MHIVIVNWNNKEDILKCLRSISQSGYISDTVVVDNGSTDGSVEEIKKAYTNGKIIKNKENLGYAGGNNVGIKYALEKGSDYIFILNPDTVVNKRAIEKLLSEIKKDDEIGIIGPKILDSDKKIWSAGGEIDPLRYSGGLFGLGKKDLGRFDQRKDVDYVSGTAMVVKRQVFEEIGFFHDDYFIYYEDVELCVRARKKEYKVIFEPKSIIIHNESSSFGKNSPSHQYYMARNHLLFVERNAPISIKLRELVRLPRTISEHRSKNEKYAAEGIKDFFKRRFGRRDDWN